METGSVYNGSWARFLLMTENNDETYIFIGGGYRDVHGM